jgi:hypothetical protein
MLFTFNNFWKTILVITGAWLIYVFAGYELTMVTMMAIIVAKSKNNAEGLF